MTRDIPSDTELLTYTEAGEKLRISPDSVKRRAQRAGWVRVLGNDGRTRVAVPVSALPGGDDVAGDNGAMSPPEPEPMAALMARLVEDLAREREKRAALEATVAALLAQAQFLNRRGLVARLRRLADYRHVDSKARPR